MMKDKVMSVGIAQFFARSNDLSVSIELPNTDMILEGNHEVLDEFIKDYGLVNVLIKEVTKTRLVMTVPQFASSRKRFIEAKLLDCAVWGCE